MTESKQHLIVRQEQDGSFTVSGGQGLPAFTTFVSGGWPQLAELRMRFNAVDWFPAREDYAAFCRRFGPSPAKDVPE